MINGFKKWGLSLLAAGALGVMPHASHAFGIPGISGGGGGNIDAFLQSAQDADTLMRKSSWNLAQAILSKDKLDALKVKREAIEKIADPKEKEAKLRDFDKDVNAELAKVDYVAKSKEMEQEHDQQKKDRTAAGAYNFLLGSLKDTELVAQGKKLATTPPSPAIATKLPKVKEFVANIGSQMDSIGKVGSGLKTLSSSVGLKDLPTKASDKPKQIAD